VNSKQTSALNYACMGGHLEVVKFLLYLKGIIIPNARNNLAFENACRHNHFEIALLLLKESNYDKKLMGFYPFKR